MNKKQEKLIFECLAVLLDVEDITINPEYQRELIDKCREAYK